VAPGETAPDETVFSAIAAAARAGVPVPLFTGGDLGRGTAAAVPRHVVLLTAVGPGGAGEEIASVYEPSSGTVHAIALGDLQAPDGGGSLDPATRAARIAALGGWPHVTWAVLPSARS
jgi:hypothetical protein